MAGKLKPLDVERENRPGKYADGDGLYLIVSGATSKNWTYRYWKQGKQRWLGLGSFKDVSLKDARLARDAARLRVKGDRTTPGVDIVQEKRAAREEAKAVEIKVTLPTFEQCAETYIREHWSTWSKKHRNQWPSSLKRYAYPIIGKLTIPQIKPSHVYELLRPIWVEKRETANRALPRKILGRDYTVSNRPGNLTALSPRLNYHPLITLLENVMRKPRDFDGELKALQDRARDLKSRKVQQLGELVIATGADSLSVDELAGALIVLTETKDAGKREAWARRGAAFFQSRARRTAPPAERHTGGARAQAGGTQPSTGSKGAA